MGLSGFFSQQASTPHRTHANVKGIATCVGFFFLFFYAYMSVIGNIMRQFNHIIGSISDINNFLTQFNGHMLSTTEK